LVAEIFEKLSQIKLLEINCTVTPFYGSVYMFFSKMTARICAKFSFQGWWWNIYSLQLAL